MYKRLKLVCIVLILGVLIGLPTLWSFAQEKMPIIKSYATLQDYEKATGKKITKFSESPMLAELVKQGKLPPVEKRLPKEPRVIEPLEEIGEYGGTINLADFGSPMGWALANWKAERLFKLLPDLKTIVPNIARGYKYSRDYKKCTIFLREGMKWSDGYPFTADDFVFWYEDVLLNKDLSPTIPAWAKPGGEVFKVRKVDDYTVEFSFSVPYPMFIYYLTRDRGEALTWGSYLPKHYLQEFHIKYNPKANDLAKERGFNSWYNLFSEVANTRHSISSAGTPTIEPWIVTKVTTEYALLERNPYYWKIDIAGNQLPYIDKIRVTAVGNRELWNLKAVSGEVDFGLISTNLKDYTLLKESEKKGNYTVRLWKQTWGNALAIRLNHTHKDPVLRKIINDVRFKRALSLAINREEINQLVFLGLGTPRQATVLPESKYFEKGLDTAYAKYDPVQAGKLLDSMGLTKRDKEGFRLRPDGKTLSLTIEFDPSSEAPVSDILELVKRYWEKIGVKIALKPESGSLIGQKRGANELDADTWHIDRSTDILFTLEPQWYVPISGQTGFAPLWYTWYSTGGKSGEEPPQEVKRLFKWFETMQSTTKEGERIIAGREILRSQARNLWIIGTVGLVPQPCLVSNKLHNVPQIGYSGYDVYWENMYEPVQFFIK